MPKPCTYPTLYEELKTISISFLSKYGCLNPNRRTGITVIWDSKQSTGFSLVIDTRLNNPHAVFSYQCGGKPISYTVKLLARPSNLGKGLVWFFVCPFTRRACRKLYFFDCYFRHRTAIQGMYEKQTRSKRSVMWEKIFGAPFRLDGLYEQLYKKHLKTRYAGKPTRKYLRITEQIRKNERALSQDEINQILELLR